MMNRMVDKPAGLFLSSFRGLSRRAVDRIVDYTGVHAHIGVLMLRAVPTTHIVNIDVRHSPRADGSAGSYTLGKLVRLASHLFINHSYIPLRVMTVWGVTLSLLSFLFALWVVVRMLWADKWVAGWASLAVLVSFLGGNILLALGVVGEYVGRLVEANSQHRQFTVFEEDV